MRRTVRVHRLGEVDYAEAHELQERLQRARVRGAVGDTLLLLEHPRTVTLGRGARDGRNLRLSEEALRARGFAVHAVGRGGDVTYHGPGQLVGYPILNLAPDRRDVRRYVQDLEALMIRVCADYGIEAGRAPKMNGCWIEDRKIGAIGVRISRWVTMHGFALNVNTALEDFGVIVPCGIADRGVTSLARELGREASEDEVPMHEVIARLEAHFAVVFDADLEAAEAPPLAGVDPGAWAPNPWRDARAEGGPRAGE
jgi:lipoyl(octanoyl) transferase